jgi:hypothetical protein
VLTVDPTGLAPPNTNPRPTHISGTVVSESDVSGQPDAQLAEQPVLAIPLVALRDVAGSTS